MSVLTDAQDLSATNAHVDGAAVVAGSNAQGSHTAAVVTFSTGVARQVSATNDAYLYINITTAAALTVAIGPTSAVATTLSVSQSSALGMTTLFVPAGWYVKLTGTMANQTCTSVLV